MDSLNLDQIAAILDLIGQVAAKTPIHWAAAASVVLVGVAGILRKIRASKVPVAVLDPKDVEPVKAAEKQIEVTLEDALDKVLRKK